MDLTVLIQRSDPAESGRVPGPHSFLGEKIYRGVIDSQMKNEGSAMATTRKRVVTRFPMITAVAFALVIVLLITLLFTSGPGSGPAFARTPEVVKALDNLAAIAAKQPLGAGHGPFYYTDIENVNTVSGAPTFESYVVGNVHTWVAPNGTALQSTIVDTTPRFTTAADRSAWIKAGRPQVATPPFATVQRFSRGSANSAPGHPPLYNVSGLPTDPARLYAVLNRENPGAVGDGKLPPGIADLDYQGACDIKSCSLFERTAALLQGPDVGMTPAFRSALFRVLAVVPGIQFLGRIDDPIGQPGTGFRLVDGTPAGDQYISCKPTRESPTPFKGGSRYWVAASAEIFTIVVNPRTSSLMSQEESFWPSTRPPSAIFLACPLLLPHLVKPSPERLLPTWDVLLGAGVVGSESAKPA